MNYETGEQNNQPAVRRKSFRRLALVAAGIGASSALAYLISRVLGRRARRVERPESIVDDRGTGQEEAARMLLNLRDRAFDASDEKLAVALGRPVEEVEGWSAANALIDDDVVMKARGIAMHRGVTIE